MFSLASLARTIINLCASVCLCVCNFAIFSQGFQPTALKLYRYVPYGSGMLWWKSGVDSWNFFFKTFFTYFLKIVFMIFNFKEKSIGIFRAVAAEGGLSASECLNIKYSRGFSGVNFISHVVFGVCWTTSLTLNKSPTDRLALKRTIK